MSVSQHLPRSWFVLQFAELEIDFQMIDVRHRPGVAPMPTRGFFGPVVIFLERVSGSRTFTCQYLLVHAFVALCSRVKGSLGDGWQMFLLGLRDVLAVGSPFGFAGKRIVVRREHLFNEVVGPPCSPFGCLLDW